MFLSDACACVCVTVSDESLQPSFCSHSSLNNTVKWKKKNQKTHILTSAVSWSRGALYGLHSCSVQSSLEVMEKRIKIANATFIYATTFTKLK